TIMLSVDRDRVVPGGTVTLTIRAVSSSPDAIRVDLPPLGGFELEGRSERTEVTPGGPGVGSRSTVVELRLRAVTPGEWRIGPLSARQGIAFAVADPVTVTILGAAPAAIAAGTTPRVARMVERAPPPPALGEAGVSVALSDSTVTTGEQVDVVTIAWFERGLRQRLRRAASLEPPQLEGLWSYAQPASAGIAASRVVNGRTYDLFIRHQVAFPLSEGTLAIPPARLSYSVPLSFQFFSQEERFEQASQPSELRVAALPADGREPAFVGAVGQRMAVSAELRPAVTRQRDAVSFVVTVRGAGNVALWPPPLVAWPRGLRVYAEGSTEAAKLGEGWMAGVKMFRYLLIPDSSGTMVIPALRYPFFDPAAGRYQVAGSLAASLVVSPATDRAIARAEPPPIRLSDREAPADRLRGSLPPVVWWSLLLLGPLAALARRPREAPRPRVTRTPAPPSDALQAAEDDLHRRVTGILGSVGGPRATASALQDAGVPRDTAERIGSLLDRYRAARFSATPGDGAELLRDTELVVKRLQGTTPRRGRSLRQRLTLTVLLSGGASAATGQVAPVQLYEAGAYRLAVAGFEQAAAAGPGMPDRWFNLGAARYRAGEDAGALVAWTVAARLLPRDRSVRRALGLVPPAGNVAAVALWASPMTPNELWLVGVVTWIVGWGAVALERRIRGRWLVLIAGSLLLFTASAGLRRWYDRPLAVAEAGQALRLAPHERAPGVGELGIMEVVEPLEERRGWVLLESAGGQEGWVPAADLVAIPRAAAQ
ncbi:MAG: hypothetical protein OEW80_01145, partial [Gemmatimonadota bacterium]|nr:hypothetical protein [Gemmatimonadota bacterium]